jgi:hypothetical protein
MEGIRSLSLDLLECFQVLLEDLDTMHEVNLDTLQVHAIFPLPFAVVRSRLITQFLMLNTS